MVFSPSVRFRAKRSIRGTTTVSPVLSIPRSSLHEGRRMFRPEATSVKILSSLKPLSLSMRRWMASPLCPSAWETLM